jgi:hypothetical protein
VYVLALAHTIGSGSDARSFWLLAILLATVLPIATIGTYRLRGGALARTSG